MIPLNLKNLIAQELRSLHRFGLETLDPTDNPFAFDFSQAAAAETDTTSPTVDSSNVETADLPKRFTQKAAPASSNPAEVSPAASKPPATTTAAKPVSNQPSLLTKTAYDSPVLEASERPAALNLIDAEVKSCTACPELCRNRTQTVFGEGDPTAKVLFLGEGPGQNEDEQGKPFVGAAGQLLDKILGASRLPRAEVYITNTVKCRPPNNRTPTDAETGSCRGYLDRQLETIQPPYIVCLGSVAAKSLLGTTLSLGKLRGRFHQYGSSKVLVTYHPAYLLRMPSAKVHVWQDMKMLMREFGVELD